MYASTTYKLRVVSVWYKASSYGFVYNIREYDSGVCFVQCKRQRLNNHVNSIGLWMQSNVI